MIDYYLSDKSLNTENKINECLDHYHKWIKEIEGSKKVLDYDEGMYHYIYEEYDRIEAENPGPQFSDDGKNIFFKSDGVLKNIDTKFMKACLLESLKRLVDEKTRDDINDRDSELNEEISNYMHAKSSHREDHFYNYPDIYENDFPDKLYQRGELRRHIIPPESGDIKDRCDSKYFELSPHQLFLKNLISPNTPYYGLLIFHGVGVGKSCSGISIAENFRDIYGKEENKIIILASQNIRIGWKSTIFNPTKGDNQCTGNSYYHDDIEDIDIDIDDKYAKKQVKKYYELFGYAAFANSVKKMLTFATKHLSDKEAIFNLKIKLIKEKFSNRVLIIDEVHNIRSDDKSIEDRDTIQYIEMVIKYSDKLRLILLTANPMYNINTEIVWILNMLLMNDNRKTVSEKELFNKKGDIVEDKLNEISRGYVSYLRGENPVSFPVRLYPTHNKEKIIGLDNRPSLDVFGKTIEGNKLSFLELYGSKLIGRQATIYTKEVSKYEGLDSLQIDIENKLLQLSNIVFPGESDDCNDLYGENGLMNTMNINKNIYSYKDDKYGEFFHKEEIGNYSSKIADILDTIENSDGIVFIYSNWIKSGLVPLVLALEQNGYTNVSGKEILKNSKQQNKISYEGEFIDKYEDKKDFIPANYLVISGSDLKSNNLEEELKILTSDENQNGQKIKVIVGSSVAAEGLDFKNIRSIHILEPWHNINKLEQVIGRGIRNCSHKKLESEDRNVTIYLHTSVTGDKESIDTYLYRYSESKAKQIGKIENILKRNSIDKYFFQNGNIYGKEDIDVITVKPAYRGSETDDDHDRSDKKYSRVCSFSETCDYMEKDVPNTEYRIHDDNKYDTYQIRYSSSIIEIYKKRIHNLFSKSVCYTLTEITNNIKGNEDYYDDILYHALKEMISDKYLLHNYNGDKGYLKRVCRYKMKTNYYLFQPYYNNDILLPTYYRINSGNTAKINYEFVEREKSKNMFLTDKHVFKSDRILESYRKLTHFEYSKLPNKYKPLDVGPGHEETIFDMLSVTNSIITLGYCFDRLDIDDKLVLCTAILTYLKHGDKYEIEQTIIDDLIVVIQKLFIYYDGNKFYYKERYEEKEKDFLVGFFLFNNNDKKPIFYNYRERTIEPYNKVDEIDIVRMIKKYQKDKIVSPKGSWGFTTYYKRIKYSDPIFTHNGIVLKVIKATDKLKKIYVYPNGPGIVIQDQGASGEWNSLLTLEFIKSEYSERYESLKKDDKTFLEQCGEKGRKKDGSKRYLVCLIECLLRENGSLIQNDLIFVKYY
jgi:hypothetical protein